jgi:ectoine hydroxylase-related dioxygenase (phytanoyl-CoA dioxygenase family)
MRNISIPDLCGQFESQGFLVLPEAIEQSQIEGLFLDVNCLLREALKSIDMPPLQSAGIDENYLLLKKLSPEIKSHAYDLITYLNSLHILARSGHIMDVIMKLSTSSVLVDGVQIRIDDQTDDRLLPLHQEVYGQISYDCLNLWVPFVPVTPATGSLRILPGSHKLGALQHQFFGEFNNAHGLVEGQVDESKIITPSLGPGDAILFHPFLVHGSSSNQSGLIRWTMVARYNPVRRIPYLENINHSLHIEQREDT